MSLFLYGALAHLVERFHGNVEIIAKLQLRIFVADS